VGSATALWTRGYLLLLTALFFGYFGQQLVLPALPLYVIELGGSPTVAGLILAAFSVSSFPLRPFVGYLSDAWSARGVLSLGTLILCVTSFGLFVPVFAVLAILNAVRGLGWAALNTGGYVVLARVTPRLRRGEASGYYNLSNAVPIALAPALALWLLAHPGLSYGSVFLLAAICGAVAFLVAWSLGRVHTYMAAEEAGRSAVPKRPSFTEFVDPRVFLAAGLLLCLTVTQVTTSAYLPLYAREIEVANIGLFYVLTGLIAILAQLLGGRYLDRGTRGGWIAAGFAMMIVSMLVLLGARSLDVILVAGVFNALGNTILNAILLVLAMDLADLNRPGAGMATFSMSYQLGAAIGAPLFGMVIDTLGFAAMFLGAALALSVGLVVTVLHWPALTQPALAAAETGGRP
jgi:predicted MFS family arabinose efflux permease